MDRMVTKVQGLMWHRKGCVSCLCGVSVCGCFSPTLNHAGLVFMTRVPTYSMVMWLIHNTGFNFNANLDML